MPESSDFEAGLEAVRAARIQYAKAAREVELSMRFGDLSRGTRLWFGNSLLSYQQAVVRVPARLLSNKQDKVLRRLTLLQRKHDRRRRRVTV